MAIIRVVELMNRVAKTLRICTGLLLSLPSGPQVYTDPGSGALMWQLVVGALVGATFYFRKLVSWFKTAKKKNGKH